MKRSFLSIFVFITILTLPRAFAQTASNTDFNPFPQMEQDQQNVDSDTTVGSDQQNDDAWPPANSDTQGSNAQ